MSDPSLELHKSVYAALVAAGVCGGRVHDRVPHAPQYPYCALFDIQLVDDGNSCFQQDEAFVDIHIYSRQLGKVEIKQQIALVRAALNVEVPVTGFTNALGQWQATRLVPSGDANSSHAVVSFRYLVQHEKF